MRAKIDHNAFATLGQWLEPPPPPPPIDKKRMKWKPRLTAAQKKLWDSVTRNILTHAEKFSGKCRTGDAMVYTSNGLKRLRSFKPDGAQFGMNDIDHEVMGFDGEKVVRAKAEGFWVEEKRDAIRCELSNGSEMTGSPRHPIWVCAESPDGKFDFRYASFYEMQQAKAEGWRFWTPFVGHSEWTSTACVKVSVKRRPTTCKVCGKSAVSRGLCQGHYQNLVRYHGEQHALTEDHLVEITPELAYSLGALVGDGSLNINHDDRCVGFTNADEECVVATAKGLSAIGCDLKPVNKHRYAFSVLPAESIKPLVRALNLAGLSYDKRIPDEIVASPKAVVAAFLRGLFDTDGTVEKTGTVSVTTTSESLGRDVQDVLAAFGIMSARRPKKSASGRPTWNIYITGENAVRFSTEIGFSIARKQARIKTACAKSFTRPHGFLGSRYGYPSPIRTVWRQAWRAADITRSKAECDRLKRLCSFGSIPSRMKVKEIIQTFGGAELFEQFLLSDNWLEVISLSDCEAELFDLCVPSVHSFLASGTINHNTWGCLNKLVRHCYDNNNALAVIVVKEKSMATKGGSWDKLMAQVLPTWRDGNRDKDGKLLDEGLGLWFSDVKYDENHNPMVFIQNRHGGWSKVVLISAPHAGQIRARIRGYEASFVFFDELTSVESDVYFTAINGQIGRVQGIPLQQFVAACNPEGESHWVYRKFFIEPLNEETGEWDEDFENIYFPSVENRVNVDERYFADLEKTLRNDPVESDRMLRGIWRDRVAGDGLFSDLFNVQIHVRPVTEDGKPHPDDGLMPDAESAVIMGVDPGAVYNVFAMGQLLPVDGRFKWVFFDEFALFKQKISYPVMVPKLMKRLAWWNDLVGKRMPLVCISDDSAVNVFRPGQGTYDALDIQREWDKNRHQFGLDPLKIRPCPKFNDSRAARVRILQTKLGQDEVVVSARCRHIRAMLEQLRSEPQKEGATYDPDKAMKPMRCDHLHVFDAMSYPMFAGSLQPTLLIPTRYNSQTLISAA